jgi:uncharacterized membrane protein
VKSWRDNGSLSFLCFLLPLAGVFVSGTLSMVHLFKVHAPCGRSSGCETILSHPSAFWIGVPVAYFGLALYAIGALVAAGAVARPASTVLVRITSLIAGVGMIANTWLTAVAVLHVGAICAWCAASAATMAAWFVSCVYRLRAEPHERHSASPMLLGSATSIVACLLVWQAYRLTQESLELPVDRTAVASLTLDHLTSGRAVLLGKGQLEGVEFADLQCGACAVSIKRLLQEKNSAVQLKLLTKRQDRVGSIKAFVSYLAAEDSSSQDWIRILLQKQPISESGTWALVAEAGLDVEAARQRFADDEDPIWLQLREDSALADRLGIRAVPVLLMKGPGGGITVSRP